MSPCDRIAAINNHVIPAKAGIAHGLLYCIGMGGWVYIMANKRDGVLYIGVTADLPTRIGQHRDGKGWSFCRRYGIDRLVYAERHDDIVSAIAREKAMKAWKRAWKIELIEQLNPDWGDLYDRLL